MRKVKTQKQLRKSDRLTNLKRAQETAERILSRVISKGQKLPSVRRLGPSGSWQIEVQVVGAAQMKALNTQYRGKRKSTDVLSFPTPAPFFERGLLGQVVVCLPVLRKQAKGFKHSDELELAVLLVHGFLHLLGLDHEQSLQQKRQMEQLEELVLLSLFGEKGALGKRNGLMEKEMHLAEVKGMLRRTRQIV